MYVNKAKKHLERLLNMPEPVSVMLWSPPGIGKSSIVRQIAEERGWGIKDIRLLLINPVDLRGIPVPNREKYRADWLHAGFLPDVERDGECGIVFLDEVTSAAPTVQASAYQLTLDRCIGDYVLPQGWKVVCAGNRINDRGVAYNMPSPLANRLIHINVECCLEDWKEWALKNSIHPSVISFLNFRSELLYRFPSEAQEIRAFPTPRTWEFVSRIMKCYGDVDEAFAIIAGTVGEGPAVEYSAFYKMYQNLSDASEILNGNFKKVSDAPDVQYALSEALVNNLAENPSPGRVENFIKYISSYFPVEFQVISMKDAWLAGVGKSIMRCPEYRTWAAANSDVIL